MKKIDLNFEDPEPEAEELTAKRVVADILTRQSTAWFWAMQQRNSRSLPAQAHETEAQHSESANWQRTSQTENTTEKGNCSICTRRSTKSSDTPAAQVGKTSRRSRQTISQARCAGWWSQCCSMEHAPPVGENQAIW